MLSQKIRTNAMTAYFFLGWLFLISRNPNFSDPFVRLHARRATRGHVFFLALFLAYSHFLAHFFQYSLPIINITLDRVISLGVFGGLLLFVLSGAYSAQKGEENTILSPLSDGIVGFQEWTFVGATEAERVKFFLSFVPFFGIFVARRHPNSIAIIGEKVGTWFALGYIAFLSFFSYDAIGTVLLFIYILGLTFVGVRCFFFDSLPIMQWIDRFPTIDEVWLILRTVPEYLFDVFRLVLGRLDRISFLDRIRAKTANDTVLTEKMEGYFTDAKFPLPRFLMFVPVVNLLFIPILILRRQSRYVLSIGQGMVITGLFLGIGFWFGFSSEYETFLIFPILLGIAAVDTAPFYRLPVVYELYALFNIATFGLLRNAQKVQDISAKNQSVNFKVQ